MEGDFWGHGKRITNTPGVLDLVFCLLFQPERQKRILSATYCLYMQTVLRRRKTGVETLGEKERAMHCCACVGTTAQMPHSSWLTIDRSSLPIDKPQRYLRSIVEAGWAVHAALVPGYCLYPSTRRVGRTEEVRGGQKLRHGSQANAR